MCPSKERKEVWKMSGKPKRRIDYAGWSVDIFSNDTKIDRLLDAHGWIGFGVYFYLCQMAFGGEGYFYEWSYDLCASTARKMGGGVGSGTVKETVDYCLQIGLFDKGLFDRWHVLTSKGIQKSYLVVLKSKNRRGTEIYSEYWLLDKSKTADYQGVVFVHKNSEKVVENGHSLGENQQTLGANSNSLKQKESKVKDSIENNIIVEPAGQDAPDDANKFRENNYQPSDFELKCVDFLIQSILNDFPNQKVPKTDAEIRKWAIHINRMQRLDGLDMVKIWNTLVWTMQNSFWRSNIRSTGKFREKFQTLYLQSKQSYQNSKKNPFNDYKQNEYDFTELEKELLSN